MSESSLDQLVKGAPQPDKIVPLMPPSGIISHLSSLSDPLASLPSSPPQIYLNLLILEASLRAQYLELRARRRQYTFFLTLLGLWNLYFGYALFLAPREDGSGVGGSIYWVIEVAEKVAFMGGIVTGILVWGTGQWERGIRWPRRWVGITNRGLRGFNCKIVIIKGPWWKEWVSTTWYFVSDGLSLSSSASAYRFIDQDLQSETEKGSKTGLPNIHEDDAPFVGHEEDISPGGDTIKLLLLPKPFSPSFRENWDLYRTEYWERENERRRLLLQKIKLQDKQRAQHQPRPSLFSRLRLHTSNRSSKDVEKSHHHGHSHAHAHSSHNHNRLNPPDGKRLRTSTSTRSTSHSRTSSRSSSPTPDFDDGGLLSRPSSSSNRVRRGSNASTSSTSSSLRKKKSNISSASASSNATPAGTAPAPAPAPAPTPSNIHPSSARVQNLSPRGSTGGSTGGKATSAGNRGITTTTTTSGSGSRSRPHSFVRGNSFSSTSTDGSASASASGSLSGSGAGSRPVTPAGVGTAAAAVGMRKGVERERDE